MDGRSNKIDGYSYKYIHSSINFNVLQRRRKNMKKEILELLAKVAEKAAKRADGRASEFGMHQPKRPDKRQ